MEWKWERGGENQEDDQLNYVHSNELNEIELTIAGLGEDYTYSDLLEAADRMRANADMYREAAFPKDQRAAAETNPEEAQMAFGQSITYDVLAEKLDRKVPYDIKHMEQDFAATIAIDGLNLKESN